MDRILIDNKEYLSSGDLVYLVLNKENSAIYLIGEDAKFLKSKNKYKEYWTGEDQFDPNLIEVLIKSKRRDIKIETIPIDFIKAKACKIIDSGRKIEFDLVKKDLYDLLISIQSGQEVDHNVLKNKYNFIY